MAAGNDFKCFLLNWNTYSVTLIPLYAIVYDPIRDNWVLV